MHSNPLHIPQHRKLDLCRVKGTDQHSSSLEPAGNRGQYARKKDVQDYNVVLFNCIIM